MNDMKTLKDRVIVITGASSGIGEAMAKVYAAQGAKVVLGARSVQKLQLLAGEIRGQGGQAAYCGVDVTKPAECRALIETAIREFGRLDVLICNAGISMRAIFDDVEPRRAAPPDGCELLGHGQLLQICTAVPPADEGLDRRHLVGCRAARTARPHGLFGLEIRHDGLPGDAAHRESQEGAPRDDRLPGVHGLERALFGADGRRFAAGRDAARRIEDDDRRAGGPDRGAGDRAPEAAVPDGGRGACDALREEVRTGIPRPDVLPGDVP